jgi:hypothetical protein
MLNEKGERFQGTVAVNISYDSVVKI